MAWTCFSLSFSPYLQRHTCRDLIIPADGPAPHSKAAVLGNTKADSTALKPIIYKSPVKSPDEPWEGTLLWHRHRAGRGACPGPVLCTLWWTSKSLFHIVGLTMRLNVPVWYFPPFVWAHVQWNLPLSEAPLGHFPSTDKLYFSGIWKTKVAKPGTYFISRKLVAWLFRSVHTCEKKGPD